MKTYEEFIIEAYKKSYGEIDEGLGTFAAKAGRFIPGLQTAVGLGIAGYRLYKGDKTGAALSAGSAIPGPVGWGFAGADIARELAKNKQSAKPATTTKPTPAPEPETKPSEASATTSPTRTPAPKPAAPAAAPVLSKKGGIEGTGIGKNFKAKAWTDTERQRYKSYTSAPSRVSRPQIGSLPPSARQVTQYPAGVPTGTSRQQPSTTPTTPKPTPATPATPSAPKPAPTPTKPVPTPTKPVPTPKPTPATPSAPKPAPTPTKPVPTPKPTPATPSAPKPQPQKGPTGMPLVGGIERRIPTSAELKAAQGKRAVQTAQKSFASSFTSPAKVSPTKPTPKPVPKPTLKST